MRLQSLSLAVQAAKDTTEVLGTDDILDQAKKFYEYLADAPYNPPAPQPPEPKWRWFW